MNVFATSDIYIDRNVKMFNSSLTQKTFMNALHTARIASTPNRSKLTELQLLV